MTQSTAKINKLTSAITDNDSASVTARFDSLLIHTEHNAQFTTDLMSLHAQLAITIGIDHTTGSVSNIPTIYNAPIATDYSTLQSVADTNQETLSFASVSKSTYCLKPIDASIASHKIPACVPSSNEDTLVATTDDTSAVENQSNLVMIDPTANGASDFIGDSNLFLMQLNPADTVSETDTQLTNEMTDDTALSTDDATESDDISDDSYTYSLVTPETPAASETVTLSNLASYIDKNATFSEFSEIQMPVAIIEKNDIDLFTAPDVISMQTGFIDVSVFINDYSIDALFDTASLSPVTEAISPDLSAQIDDIDESFTYSDTYYSEASIYSETVQLIG